MAGRCAVFGNHRTEFAFVGRVLTIITVVDGDDSRPVRVENRHGESFKQKGGDELKPVTVERMQLRQNSVVTQCSVGIVASIPNRVLVGTSHDNDEPDVAGVEGAPLDTRQWKGRNDLFRYAFDIRRRKESVWIGDREHIQIQTLSRGQFG